MSAQDGPGTLTRALVALATLLVPRRERVRFRREWQSELWHARAVERVGVRTLIARAAGAFRDALTVRALAVEPPTHTSPARGLGLFAAEVRLAIRSLARAPAFTSVAVLTVGLGLGGTAGIATLLDRIVLRPLPYPAAERLVQLENEVPGVGDGTVWGMSTAQYVFLDEESPSFEAVGLYRGLGGNLGLASGPVRASGWFVTPDLFQVLGGRAQLGRALRTADGAPEAPAVMLLSDGFWRTAFGADPSVIGSSVLFQGQPVEVVGVLERDFRIPGATLAGSQVYMPIQIDRGGRFYNSHVFRMVGLLAEGVTPEAADRDMDATLPRLSERFPQAYPVSFFDRYGFRPFATPLKERVVGDMARSLWILVGGVGLVFLIALANTTNLFVVRVEERRQELVVRSALGAGRGALARHLIAEALTLTLAGAVLAIAIARWGVPALVSLSPDTLPRSEGLTISAGVVAFTVVLAGFMALVLPAYSILVTAAVGEGDSLRVDSRGASRGRSRRGLREALVVGQVALALTLATGAGLLVRSGRALSTLDPGFRPAGGMTVDVFLERSRYASDVAVWQAQREILERIRGLADVRSAGFATDLPLSGGFGCTVQGFEDPNVYDRIGDSGLTTCAGQTFATPGYFEALGIPLVSGRTFRDQDNDDPSGAAVVVSQAFAHRFFPGEDAIGKGVAPSGRTEGPFYRIVGVVGDVPSATLDGPPAMAIYYPMVQDPRTPGNWGAWRHTSLSLVVNARAGDALELLGAIRREIQAVDAAAPMTHAMSLEERVGRSMARTTFLSTLLQTAAAVALILSAIGIYGVISYGVERRTREIGTRLALGARPAQVRREIVSGFAVLAAAGLAIGLALSLAAGRVLESLLFGIAPTDPAVLTMATALMAAVALLASWTPALRITAIDPVVALQDG